jgi:hypothetical protein
MIENFIIMMKMIAFAKDLAKQLGVSEAEGMIEFHKMMSVTWEKD